MLLDHPANPGHPVPWYASTRQPAYGLEGWTNFLNAAFLWDGPLAVAAGDELRLRYRFVVHDGRWDRDRIEATAAAWTTWCDRDRREATPHDRHVGQQPEWTGAGGRADRSRRRHARRAGRAPPPGVPHPRRVRRPPGRARRGRGPRLHVGHLADAGVEQVAGTGIDEAIASVLRRIDGPNTHTFFSYRVAETLARYGSFADNRLIADWDQAARDNLAEACDTSRLDPAARPGAAPQLRRGAVALRGRPPGARPAGRLGRGRGRGRRPGRAGPDAAVRATPAATSTTRPTTSVATTSTPPTCGCSPSRWPIGWGPSGPRGWPPRSAWSRWSGSPDGTAVGWGRSTGVLSAALTIELAALAVAGGHTDRPGLWLRRAADAHRQPRPVVPRRAHHRPPAQVDLRVPRARSGACSSRSTSSGSWPGPPRSWRTRRPHPRGGRRRRAYPLAGPARPVRGRARPPRCGPIAAPAPSW